LRVTPTALAIALLPSAASSTISARVASACAILRLRSRRSRAAALGSAQHNLDRPPSCLLRITRRGTQNQTPPELPGNF
jgi:hypothetical protein